MALHDVVVSVDYLDAAERTATRDYLLRDQYDDADTESFDAIQQEAAALITDLEALSWSDITNYRVVVQFVNTDTSANIAANNQVVAFTRVRTSSGAKAYFEVPAWDDAVYDQNSQNLLSAAYNAAAQDVADRLRDPETGEDMSGALDYSQSRTRKSRNVIRD